MMNEELGKALLQIEALHARLAAVEAERDAARAGEARAVEALRSLVRDCTTTHPDWGIDITKPSGSTMSKAVSVLAGCSALAWLDQQRREAAAAALEEFADDAVCMEKLITCNIFDLRSALRTRAAALWAGEMRNG